MDRVHFLATYFQGRASRLLCLSTTLLLAASTVASPACAAALEVSFDVTPSIACRDVTPPEFAEANPDERLVEAQVEVSSLIRRGKEQALLEYFYRFDSPRRTLRISDYAPKTTLASEVAGNIAVEDKQEATRGLGVTVASPLDWPVKFGSSGELGTKNLHSTRYELVPPMSTVAASGTLDRGHSVYFKLRPSRSTSLEGSRSFTLVFRVASDWRADYVRLSCTAVSQTTGLLGSLDERTACGQKRFVVALYATGDASAKAAAERLVRAESELWKTVSANRQALERRFYPTLAQRVSALFEGDWPACPDDVAEAIVYGDESSGKELLDLRLPAEVRQAVVRYTVARRALSRLPDAEPPAETSRVQ